MTVGAHALVIAYGNPLRGDDGVARRVAEALADRRPLDTVVCTVHQLLPELALDLAGATLAVLIDARRDLAPGRFVVERVTPTTHRPAWSHHLLPASLARMAEELYGWTGSLFVVGIGAASMDATTKVSPAVEAAVPAVVDVVVQLLATHGTTADPSLLTSF
jgi:hydrogenase maturation protease